MVGGGRLASSIRTKIFQKIFQGLLGILKMLDILSDLPLYFQVECIAGERSAKPYHIFKFQRVGSKAFLYCCRLSKNPNFVIIVHNYYLMAFS